MARLGMVPTRVGELFWCFTSEEVKIEVFSAERAHMIHEKLSVGKTLGMLITTGREWSKNCKLAMLALG